MTSLTHTHKTQGGRFALVGEQPGGGVLEGQTLVCYHDMDKDLKSVTTEEDWRQHWQPVAADTCTVCMGTGKDAIKGNKLAPCGGCYGLGKVRQDGEKPSSEWELAEVALGIIQPLQAEVQQLQRITRLPEVLELVKRRAQRQEDAQARQEREWRESRGHGPGGSRYTGD